MRRDPHVLPNPSPAQCRAAILKIAKMRAKAGQLVAPHDFERHRDVTQIVTYEIAPLVAAGLVERSRVDALLNRAVGRSGVTLENAVLSRALVRLGRRARGLA